MTLIGCDILKIGSQRSDLLRILGGGGTMRNGEGGKMSVGVEGIKFTEGDLDDVQGEGGVVRPSM